MHAMFQRPIGGSPFEESVECTFALKRDAAGVARRFPLPCAIVRGNDLAGGAGASVAPETGDRLSVIVRRSAWPLEEIPAPGARFAVGGEPGIFVCKSVQPFPHGWELICTRNMRGEQV